MATKYDEIEDGKWYPLESMLVQNNLDLSCCCCHLVHRLTFRMRNGVIETRFKRDDRATGQLRRHHKVEL